MFVARPARTPVLRSADLGAVAARLQCFPLALRLLYRSLSAIESGYQVEEQT